MARRSWKGEYAAERRTAERALNSDGPACNANGSPAAPIIDGARVAVRCDPCTIASSPNGVALGAHPERSVVGAEDGTRAASRAFGRTRDLDGVYRAALDTLAECLDVSRASVLPFDPDGVMRFKAYRGLSDDYRAAVQGHSPWTPDSVDPEPILVPDLACEPSLREYLPVFARERIAALAFIPLVSLGRVIGRFMLYYDGRRLARSEGFRDPAGRRPASRNGGM